MITIVGKYTSANVYTDYVEKSAYGQILAICNMAIFDGCKISIMPDVHAGAGCVIGTTIQLNGAVLPSLVGVDIGCGVYAVKLREKRVNLPEIDSVIKNWVPSATDKHSRCNISARAADAVEKIIQSMYCYRSINSNSALCSIGTLGGGNHFIEIDRDADENLYLIIHTGSRHLGIEVEKHYRQMAYQEYKENESRAIVDAIKSKGINGKELESAIKSELNKLSKQIKANREYYSYNCPLTGELYDQYLHDMLLAQEYAALNRKLIADIILKKAKLHRAEDDSWGTVDTIHNYIDRNGVLRKGAISAHAGEHLIIPLNMRDGALFCIGKGNKEWNESAPHGAGRKFSRADTKANYTLQQYKESMAGIFSTSVSNGTLDECPMAYKDPSSITEFITDTVDIAFTTKPIYNFKAGKDE